jgi:hypothetical protein
MDEIISLGENIKIYKERTTFKIEFNYKSYALINSLLGTYIIRGGSTNESYNLLKFKADSVKTLDDFLNENKRKHGKKAFLVSDSAKMIRTLTTQLEYLISVENHTILGYDPSLIIVINDEKFAYLGELIVQLVNEESAMITCPFLPNNFFASPELLKITEIPSFVHYKTAYFSLGLLTVYVLLGDDSPYFDFIKNNDVKNILNTLNNHPVKYTKIYWLISRCLVKEPTNRSIILI